MSALPPRLVSVNISGGGVPKLPLDEAEITTAGIIGDAHDHEKHNTPMQAICLIDAEVLDDLRGEGFELGPGTIGENFTMRGTRVGELAIGERLRFEGGVELEITKRRTPCYVLDAIDPRLRAAIAGRTGVYAKVLRTGRVRPGAAVQRLPAAAGEGAAR